jgi:tRNA nucleotidyltransferase/poly(A) polymerase
LLRAVRIAARFGLTIDIATRAAIIEMAADISAVSSERIAAEMQKMLDHPQRATAIRLLEEFGLLHAVFPEFGQSLANPETLQRTLNRLDAIAQPDFVACLSVLGMSHIESLASSEQAVAIKRLVRNLKSRWRLSNDNAVAIEFTLMNASAFFAAEHLQWSVLQPLLVSPYVDHALHFASAILRADFGTDRALDRCRECLKLSSAELNPVPLVDGQLLMSLGLPTSPLYARLIKLGRIAQLDGEIRTRDEAAEWARRQIS